MERKFFVWRDLWALSFLFLVLSSFYFVSYFVSTYRGSKGERYAEITVNGQMDQLVPLSEKRFYYSPTGLPGVKIVVREETVGFVQSDCPDKICVHMGFLSLPGQSAVCLPNRVVIRVVTREREEEALDSVIY
ncbi:MAG: NusG domain II-containing protein [Synergistaceae bacterium]|nr:NusG domain II-containing protein [Synergistaceae bacterium]